MSQSTKIEWVKNADGSQGHSANPIRFRDKATGKTVNFCVKHSSGCANCYAERLGKRRNSPDFIARNLDKVECFLDEKVLQAIVRRRKPATYFLCDMTDWMAEWVPDEFIDRIFATAALCPQHTFQLLTKRAERLPAYMAMVEEEKDMQRWINAAADLANSPCVGHLADELEYPLKNVWLGVSCETQTTADERIPHLLNTQAAIRFVSAEPLLGPIDLRRFIDDIDWLIIGGESGSRARPCNVECVRSLVRQCQAAGVECFVKQLGRHVHITSPGGQVTSWFPQDPKGGDVDEWPSDCRIREIPEVAR